MYIKLMQLYN